METTPTLEDQYLIAQLQYAKHYIPYKYIMDCIEHAKKNNYVYVIDPMQEIVLRDYRAATNKLIEAQSLLFRYNQVKAYDIAYINYMDALLDFEDSDWGEDAQFVYDTAKLQFEEAQNNYKYFLKNYM